MRSGVRGPVTASRCNDGIRCRSPHSKILRSIAVKRSLLFLLLFCSLVLGPTLEASALVQKSRPRPQATKPRPSTAPTSAAAPLAEAAPFVNKVLPNGLEVIVLEDHSVPLVTVELAVRNGSFTEPPELNGLSHLFEHMFFKLNPETARTLDYVRNIDSLGIVYNGETHEEVVNYYFTTTTLNFPVALRYMRDQAVFQRFHEEQFAQEREVVVGELDRHESNPYLKLSEEMNARLFYKYPSRKDPGGNR